MAIRKPFVRTARLETTLRMVYHAPEGGREGREGGEGGREGKEGGEGGRGGREGREGGRGGREGGRGETRMERRGGGGRENLGHLFTTRQLSHVFFCYWYMTLYIQGLMGGGMIFPFLFTSLWAKKSPQATS